MYFDDKYFKTEEIDGFVVDSMMKRAWAAEMEIMQEIDRICKENDLQYYAAWGTLLGTIRLMKVSAPSIQSAHLPPVFLFCRSICTWYLP